MAYYLLDVTWDFRINIWPFLSEIVVDTRSWDRHMKRNFDDQCLVGLYTDKNDKYWNSEKCGRSIHRMVM